MRRPRNCFFSTKRLVGFATIMTLAIPTPIFSQSEADLRSANDGEVVLELLDKEVQVETLIDQSIVGFIGVLDANSFPGIFQFRTGRSSICTATLIGPGALLTAAHCLGDENYNVVIEGSRFSADCYHSRTYNVGIEHANDWALCTLDQPVPTDFVAIYETLDVSRRPQAGDVVMLTGYGCTVEDGVGSPSLLYGYARTIDRPASVLREDTAFWTQAIIGDPNNSASLCAGDSGGPVFRTGPAGPTSSPRIVGVNSRVNYDAEISWFSSTASKTGIGFFNSFVRVLDQPICGLEYNGQPYRLNCRI